MQPGGQPGDLSNHVAGETAINTTIAIILRAKADSTIHPVRPDASVFEAGQPMALKSFGALL